MEQPILAELGAILLAMVCTGWLAIYLPPFEASSMNDCNAHVFNLWVVGSIYNILSCSFSEVLRYIVCVCSSSGEGHHAQAPSRHDCSFSMCCKRCFARSVILTVVIVFVGVVPVWVSVMPTCGSTFLSVLSPVLLRHCLSTALQCALHDVAGADELDSVSTIMATCEELVEVVSKLLCYANSTVESTILKLLAQSLVEGAVRCSIPVRVALSVQLPRDLAGVHKLTAGALTMLLGVCGVLGALLLGPCFGQSMWYFTSCTFGIAVTVGSSAWIFCGGSAEVEDAEVERRWSNKVAEQSLRDCCEYSAHLAAVFILKTLAARQRTCGKAAVTIDLDLRTASMAGSIIEIAGDLVFLMLEVASATACIKIFGDILGDQRPRLFHFWAREPGVPSASHCVARMCTGIETSRLFSKIISSAGVMLFGSGLMNCPSGSVLHR